MSKTSQVRARTDSETKARAEEILMELGLTPSAAINMFYRQIVLRRALPFAVEVPNATTAAAISEARSGESLIEAEDLPELLTALLTKRERTVDLADLLEADPAVLEAVQRIRQTKG